MAACLGDCDVSVRCAAAAALSAVAPPGDAGAVEAAAAQLAVWKICTPKKVSAKGHLKITIPGST